VSENVVTEGEVEKMRADWRARLDADWKRARATRPTALTGSTAAGPTSKRRATPTTRAAAIRCAARMLKQIGQEITEIPQGFHAHRTIQRFLENRRKAIETGGASTGRRPRRWRSAR
jgi:2-oxoglutarate dehydrogenase E1 component